MLSKLITVPLFIAAGVMARPTILPRDDRIPLLSQWSQGNLESWWSWKVRFISLGCQDQRDTEFFDMCCLPLPAGQTTADLVDYCTPATRTCAGVNPYAVTTPSPEPAPPSEPVTTLESEVTDPVPEVVDPVPEVVDPVPEVAGDDESGLPYCEDPNDDGYDYIYDDDWETEPSYYEEAYDPPAEPAPAPEDNYDSGNDYNYDSGNDDYNYDSGNDDYNYDSGNNDSGNNNGGTEYGDAYATYYYQNGNAGACGEYKGDYDLIGAINVAFYGDMGQKSQYCGSSVTVTNLNNGRSVNLIVADVCPSCVTPNSFDLSVGAFQAIADLSEGMVPITWHFN